MNAANCQVRFSNLDEMQYICRRRPDVIDSANQTFTPTHEERKKGKEGGKRLDIQVRGVVVYLGAGGLDGMVPKSEMLG